MSDPQSDNLSFEQALGELDRIVQDLEDGSLGLEDSLDRYERGVGLLKRCHADLQRAEQRIMLVVSAEDEERPILQAFDHSATAETSRNAVRRPRKPNGGPDIPF